jgi:uncharacterized repeat protein (TIGR04138 family)
MSQENVELILDEDAPCEACGFNLRGLPTRHICPECGGDYEFSTEYSCLDSECRQLGRRTGFHTDAIMFVREAVAHVAGAGKRDSSWKERHIAAWDLCRGLREFALIFFDTEADARFMFTAWGLRTSEDLGRLVFALVKEGALSVSPNDLPCDFDGLFTLEDFFTRPHPRLDRAERDR